MNLYVVQPGDTIDSIAERYNISVTRLIQDNDLEAPNNLVVGQVIVIVYPEQTYIVQYGDSLNGIAAAHGVTLMQLLRNNPFLSDRDFIYPGETIIISYNTDKGIISTNGYAFPYINKAILEKTLPFLTYLTVFNYRAIDDGEIISYNDDSDIIQTAKEYGVAPLMLLTTLTIQGGANIEVAFRILYDEELQNYHIENMITILKAKGYYGLNISFQYINTSNLQQYENFLTNITNRLNMEGFPVFVTINPRLNFNESGISFERINYSIIGQMAYGIMLLTYNWGYYFGPPVPISVNTSREFLDYAIELVPPEKIFIGIQTIGYDWQLPYEIGATSTKALNVNSALSLAAEVGATILYDEISQAPYFQYVDNSLGVPKQHIVWFKDARSIDATMQQVSEYGFKGVDVWNIMYFFAQMWLVINSQYVIDKVSPELLI